MDNQTIALELEAVFHSAFLQALEKLGIDAFKATSLFGSNPAPAPTSVGGDVVAWRYDHKTIGDVFIYPNRAVMDKRYWIETPLYAALQAQPTASTAQPDDLERLLGRITCTAETSARLMRDAKNTGGWWGAENTAKNFDIIAKQTDDLRAALAALQAQPAPMGGDVVERATIEVSRLTHELDITNADHIALWLERNTIPDEPMSQCTSWLACRIVEAHEAALAAMQQAPVPDIVGRLRAWASDMRMFGSADQDLREAADMLERLSTQPQPDAAVAVEQWQPIETAPKDGAPFVAGRFTGEGKNHDGLQQVDRWHSKSRGDSYDGLGKFNTQFWPATHWMPLLAPPAAIRAGGQP